MSPESAACDNLNHRRSDAPVGYCPQCGKRVNARLRTFACDDALHARARRQRDAWCVHCGVTLRVAPRLPRRV
jgi:hypothetical protein